ncbi:MAG: molybdopterin-binding protein [Planctomycetota bacterium]|jgi:hypothetical protein
MEHGKNEDGDPRAPGARVVPLEDAVGMVLAHDVTEIVPGERKGPAFRKGHVIAETDLPHLARLGKRHLYVLDIGEDHLHEDEAVERLAAALCGPGTEVSGAPREGKIEIVANRDGLLDLDVERLVDFNGVPDVMCATRHRKTFVRKGERLAGTRAIPLVVAKTHIDEACRIAGVDGGLITVKSLHPVRAGLVVTGNEVAEGLIEDRFAPIVREKLESLGSTVLESIITPDDRAAVAGAIRTLLERGADLVITTAGMSVDPDDVTRLSIADAGGRDLEYGAPMLPGAMFLVGFLDGPKGEVPVLGVPACALFFKATILDIVLPRILAQERLTRREIARLAHGGLCLGCEDRCRFPQCGFGRGS